MKLPKLPSLKKKKNATSGRATTVHPSLGKMKLKPLPTAPGERGVEGKSPVPIWSAVDRQPQGWGGDVWFEVEGAATEKASVGGVCAKCGAQVRAIDLKLRRRIDGTEIWACDWCRKVRK